MLICPLCQNPLILNQKSYRCTNNHSFDIAKEGYVNLHLVQHKKSKNPGDTPQAVQARRRFLISGFYAPLKSAIMDTVNALNVQTVLDIGCGEGYYTTGLSEVAERVIGVDIAKSAVQTASKAYKGWADSRDNITWVVGTGAMLPVADKSVGLCTSFFSPLPVSEMVRVLKDDGYLLVATPAPRHLYALREQLFGEVKLHEPEKFIDALAPDFRLISEQMVSSDFHLNNTQIKDLLAMTPYAYKAKADRRASLEMMDGLGVGAQFMVYLFQTAPKSKTADLRYNQTTLDAIQSAQRGDVEICDTPQEALQVMIKAVDD